MRRFDEILRHADEHTEPRLRKEDGGPDFNLKFYLINKDGTHAGATMWGPATFAVCDENGARLEDCAALYEREE